MIQLVRCDDRLIHGQCVVRVISDFGIGHIVVCDDFVAGNAVLKNVFLLAAPSGVKTEILSVEQAAARADALQAEAAKVLILVRSPETALSLYLAAPQLKKELNIGPMSNRPISKKATMYCSLTPNEAVAVRQLAFLGVRVYFNQVISQKAVEWAEVEQQFR
ncbi:MAG TPA: PTS sugar transporter subunit IIB [Feifaniaceae bacterium]|nr:PTS sugar transporter subunit IIB [Feifaniaceae bacterium]